MRIVEALQRPALLCALAALGAESSSSIADTPREFDAAIVARGVVEFAPRGATTTLSLETVGLTREHAAPVAAMPPRIRRDARGASIERGRALERVEIAPHGVE